MRVAIAKVEGEATYNWRTVETRKVIIYFSINISYTVLTINLDIRVISASFATPQ